VPRVSIVGHSHGRLLPLCNSRDSTQKKNLTENNHKVSLFGGKLEARAPLRLRRNAKSLRKLRAGSSVSEAFMQDAHVGTWLRAAHVSAEIQASVRDLNHRFLDLVVERPGGWSMPGQGLSAAVSARIAPLSAAQKSAAANCPYALFDLRFHDDGYWRARLRAAVPGGVAEGTTVDAKTLEFARLALFFAW